MAHGVAALSPNFSASSESLPILAHSTSTLHPPPPPPILRNRTQSTPTKPPTAVRLSSAYDGLETYGAGDEASGAETRSIRMGGERPLSATFREGATNKRYSGMSEGGETIASLGYLFLDDPRHAAASDERHLSGIGEQDNGFTPVVRDVRSTTRAMTGGQPARSHYGMFESGPSVPPFPGASGEEMRDSFDERGRRVLGKEEAWYFLRELVGQELKLEEGLLWKLSSLVAEDEEEDMFASPDQASDFLDAREAPILRYLIRHFLLTLPLIRDTTREGSTSSIPDFWTSGLHVLIRKVHDADLSHDVDTSSKSLASTLYSSVVRKSLERFVSAGLKLSRAHGGEEESAPRPGRDDLETEPPRNATPGPSQERDVSSSSPLARQPLQDILWNSPPPLQPNDLVPPPPPIPTKPFPMKAAVRTPPLQSFPLFSSSPTSDHHPEDDPSRPISRQTVTTNSREDELSFFSAQEMASRASEVSDSDADVETMRSFGDESPLEEFATEESAEHGFAGWTPTGEMVSPQNDLLLPATPNTGALPSPLLFPGYKVDEQDYDSTFVAGTPHPEGLGLATSSLVNTALENVSPRSASHSVKSGKSDKSKRRLSIGLKNLLRKKSSGKLPPSPSLVEPSPHLPTSAFATPAPDFAPSSSAQPSPSNLEQTFPTGRHTPSTVTPTTTQLDTWLSNMALPTEVLSPVPSEPQALAIHLIPKGGAPWPFGAPVPFWRGTPVSKLQWGGFETDVVAVRSSLFSKAFVIRVRRPGRLDEYVVRTEAQFIKYQKVLEKQFPHAHVRRVPLGSPKDDQAIPPSPSARPISSISAVLPPTTHSSPNGTMRLSPAASRLAANLREVAEDPQAFVIKRPTSSFVKSMSKQSVAQDSNANATKRSRRATVGNGARPLTMSSIQTNVTLPSHLVTPLDMKRLPTKDAERRALRNWLRDTLSIRTIGHHKETAAFLLMGPIAPRQSDVKDLRQREAVDEARRAARVAVAQGSTERVKALKDSWASVEDECIHGNGFENISEALREVSKVEELPPRYVKSLEWMRMSFAETLFEILVSGPNSGSTFAKLKALHHAFPYFLVRQAFKLGKTSLVTKVLQDILLGRPFGAKSLLQKILATCLDDDPEQMMAQITKYRSRIGSTAATEKIDIWVYGDPEHKDAVRNYARDNNIELVLCILRGADEPRLPPLELERILKAGTKYRRFMKTSPSQLSKANTSDVDVRLILDLQVYLRLVAQDRDANSIREMLGDESTAAALEVMAEPFVDFIKRVYNVGSASSALADLQNFLNQLVIIVEALRSRVQEPQKAIRILGRLLARHQQALYTFVHSVHCGDNIVEEFLQWGWTASVFLRRGLAKTIDVDALLPHHVEDQASLCDELRALVDYHQKKRLLQLQVLCRRNAGDVDADDPIIVEGDGRGKSQVEPLVDVKPRRPTLREIPYCLESFGVQLKQVFSL